MTSGATIEEVAGTRIRCQACGTKAEFPANFTEKEASQYCRVCSFHRNHELTDDPRCPICVARFWSTRLRALRILLLYRSTLRLEELQ